MKRAAQTALQITKSVLVQGLAVCLALLVGGVLVAFVGVNPLAAYGYLWLGAFGSVESIAETTVKAVPLLLAGLGVAFALHCGAINIGAEGQLYMGGVAAALSGLFMPNLPPIVLLPLVFLASFLLGGVWGAIQGIIKARTGASEVVTGIMMNYIAIYLVSYLVNGPIQEPLGIYPYTDRISANAWLPVLVPQTRLHAGLVIGLLCALLMYLMLWRTSVGYEIRMVGANSEVAMCSGIDVTRSIIIAMFVSGGLAGLAGMGEVSGIQHRLMAELSPGYGYSALAVALLGKIHPMGVVMAAFFFASLRSGAGYMQRGANIPVYVTYILEGLVVLFILSSKRLEKYRLPRRQ